MNILEFLINSIELRRFYRNNLIIKNGIFSNKKFTWLQMMAKTLIFLQKVHVFWINFKI